MSFTVGAAEIELSVTTSSRCGCGVADDVVGGRRVAVIEGATEVDVDASDVFADAEFSKVVGRLPVRMVLSNKTHVMA